MNSVNLIGRLTKEPVLRKTESGMSVCSFTLAVNRDVKKEGQPTADFINCQAWNIVADNMCKYLSKGSQIGLKGRIQTRNYDDEKGQKKYVTEVVVEKIEFLESRKKEETSYYGHEQEWAQQEKELAEYAENHPNGPYVQGSYKSDLDIQSDDLPF